MVRIHGSEILGEMIDKRLSALQSRCSAAGTRCRPPAGARAGGLQVPSQLEVPGTGMSGRCPRPVTVTGHRGLPVTVTLLAPAAAAARTGP
eukprot:2531609-Rhodomonas_salina.1